MTGVVIEDKPLIAVVTASSEIHEEHLRYKQIM